MSFKKKNLKMDIAFKLNRTYMYTQVPPSLSKIIFIFIIDQ